MPVACELFDRRIRSAHLFVQASEAVREPLWILGGYREQPDAARPERLSSFDFDADVLWIRRFFQNNVPASAVRCDSIDARAARTVAAVAKPM